MQLPQGLAPAVEQDGFLFPLGITSLPAQHRARHNPEETTIVPLRSKKLMAPLWLKYPEAGRYSIAWRMGGGEEYQQQFYDWYSSLPGTEQAQYQEMFPEPKGWLGWYDEPSADLDCYEESGRLLWNADGGLRNSLKSTQTDYQGSGRLEFVFFWGNEPTADGSISKSCLSQWWMSDFYVEAERYCCMEQFMMAEKARLFEDTATLAQIMKSTNPKHIKALGRKVQGFDDATWLRNRCSIVLNGNYAKFLQNPELRSYLLGTESRVLVEASPLDKVWGIGMAASDEGVENPLNWKGLNLLGFALMEVREELARVCQAIDRVNE